MPSANLRCLGSKVAAIYPRALYHLGSPEKRKQLLSFLKSKSYITVKRGGSFAFQSEDEIKSSHKWCTVQRK